MKNVLCMLGVLAVTSVLNSPAMAGNPQAGKEKAEGACQTCHGTDGIATMAMTPNLSGQREEYMVIQLRNFRDGKRRHEQMSIIAKMLTDDDIDNVSAWYSSIKITLEMPQ